VDIVKKKERKTMALTYVRRFNLKGSLSVQEAASFWKFLLSEFVPTIQSLLVVVITLPLATISARAAELAPMVGLEKNFRTGASALIYYTEGVDGDNVVTTVQSDDTESMKIFRFISILAPGQTAEISVPHELGQTADTIVIRRVGNRLLVEDGVVVASTKQGDAQRPELAVGLR
jgi:hypothetical protein